MNVLLYYICLGEHVHNQLEMLTHQCHDEDPCGHHHGQHHHDEYLDIDHIVGRHHSYADHHPPHVAHEGPITTAAVYHDDHHMHHHLLNGPGIHDQPDVHYEEEMDAHMDHHDMHHHDMDRRKKHEIVGESYHLEISIGPRISQKRLI